MKLTFLLSEAQYEIFLYNLKKVENIFADPKLGWNINRRPCCHFAGWHASSINGIMKLIAVAEELPKVLLYSQWFTSVILFIIFIN
jgi:hypothetical protein